MIKQLQIERGQLQDEVNRQHDLLATQLQKKEEDVIIEEPILIPQKQEETRPCKETNEANSSVEESEFVYDTKAEKLLFFNEVLTFQL